VNRLLAECAASTICREYHCGHEHGPYLRALSHECNTDIVTPECRSSAFLPYSHCSVCLDLGSEFFTRQQSLGQPAISSTKVPANKSYTWYFTQSSQTFTVFEFC
ncbi:unnamed protein product, partial [Ectocarpus sp. 12 AP-2014]